MEGERKPVTPETVFIAILALLTVQVSSAPLPMNNLINNTYWAYVPSPPLFHLASWDGEEIQVSSRYFEIMGGDSNSYAIPRVSAPFDFYATTHHVPLCFSKDNTPPMPLCISLAMRTAVADSPLNDKKATLTSGQSMMLILVTYGSYLIFLLMNTILP